MALTDGPIWMVPRRPDPDFVGRAAELAALEKALAASGSSALTQPAGVHGLGGVGKTLLAVEFAHRHADAYDAVFWLAAENPTTLAPAFAELARELSLPEAGEPDQNVRIAAVLRWLETHARWLLVLDNAERREDVAPYVPRRYAGHVLITSRNPDWHGLARVVKVRPLPRAESIALLCKGLESGDAAEADRLAEALGDLPLALAQAAAFVRETGVRFADYLERFQTRWAEFDREQRAEPGYGRTVAVTLALTLDRLREGGTDASPAETLLARCAFYAPDRIPRDLLADELPGDTTLHAAIRTLRSHSLVEAELGFVTVHRLVQRAIRDRITPETQAEFAKHAVQKLRERFPSESKDVRTWPECRKLIDHVLNAAAIAQDYNVALDATATLLSDAGDFFQSLGDLPKAVSLQEHALKIREAAQGVGHPAVASVLNRLGIALRIRGDLAKARQCQERALRIFESANGPDHPDVATALGSLGLVARLQGDLDEARRSQERALRIKEAVFGPDHPEVAITLNNLGTVAQDQGELGEARRYQERALRIKEDAYGPNHPRVAVTLGNLGKVALLAGDLAEARRCQEEALRINEAAYGPDHLMVAVTLHRLGGLLAQDGEPARAILFVERALGIRLKLLGKSHRLTIAVRELLQEVEDQIRGAKSERTNGPGGNMITVLFLAANPAGTTRLALDEEIRAIDAKIRSSELRDHLKMEPHLAVRLDDLSGLLMRQRPDVVHFSGHGGKSGGIYLVGANKRTKLVRPVALAEMFRVLKDNVRVVVLNACYTEAQALAIVQSIDCAIGMSREIRDSHAIAFAAEFYQALGYGRSVRDAFDLGVARLMGEGGAKAKELAKLHLKDGVDPSQIILVGADSTRP